MIECSAASTTTGNAKGAVMKSASNPADEPRREKLMPQASIRFFLLTIGGSAMIMVIFRIALLSEAIWAIVIALLFSLICVMFLIYLALFLVANALAASAKSLRSNAPHVSELQNSNRKLHS